MREIIKWIIALILGALSGLVVLGTVLIRFVLGLLAIMGVMAMSAKLIIDDMDENSGNVFLKSKSPEDNRKIIEMLYADYKAGYAYASETYEALGPTSQSAKFRDIYDALPQETKDDIRRIWGRDNMMVSAENLKAIFGVRKIG